MEAAIVQFHLLSKVILLDLKVLSAEHLAIEVVQTTEVGDVQASAILIFVMRLSGCCLHDSFTPRWFESRQEMIDPPTCLRRRCSSPAKQSSCALGGYFPICPALDVQKERTRSRFRRQRRIRRGIRFRQLAPKPPCALASVH